PELRHPEMHTLSLHDALPILVDSDIHANLERGWGWARDLDGSSRQVWIVRRVDWYVRDDLDVGEIGRRVVRGEPSALLSGVVDADIGEDHSAEVNDPANEQSEQDGHECHLHDCRASLIGIRHVDDPG